MSSEYVIAGESILRDGQEIARYSEETNTVTSPKRLAPIFAGAINKLVEQLGKSKATFKVDGAEDSESQGEATPPADKSKRHQRVIPEPPPTDPRAGDKTPAYIRWYREHHTEAEFHAKYGHRKFEEAE